MTRPAGNADISLIVPTHDLEAQALAGIAGRLGIHVVPLDLRWGDRFRPSLVDVETLRKVVVLAETPSLDLEEYLRRAGRWVEVIDHHLYTASRAGTLDRRNGLSTLEQFLPLVGGPEFGDPDILPGDWRCVAANARGFRPALYATLAAEGIRQDMIKHEIEALRARDLGWAMRGNATTALSADDVAAGLAATDAFLQQASAAGDVAIISTQRNVPNDPLLVLVRAPLCHRFTLLDAVYRWRVQTEHEGSKDLGAALARTRDVLMLFHDAADRNQPVRIEFSGAAAHLDLVEQTITQLSDPASPCRRLTLWAGGCETIFFGAEAPTPADRGLLNNVADQLLDSLLIGNRPVLGWRTSFLQPFALNSARTAAALRKQIKWQADGVSLVKVDPQERNYFEPYLHDYLTPWSGSGISDEALVRCDHHLATLQFDLAKRVGGTLVLSLQLKYKGKDNARLECPITAARVHLFHADTFVVEWEIGETWWQRDKTDKRDLQFWQWLLVTGAAVFAPTLAQVLDINGKGRYVFCSFEEEEPTGIALFVRRDGAPDKLLGSLQQGGPISANRLTGWFAALLKVILPHVGIGTADLFERLANPTTEAADADAAERELGINLLSDDRARVFSSVVLAGSRPAQAAGQQAMDIPLARLATVDPYGQGHACDPGFALQELRAGLYQRFAAWGSLFAATSHSFVFLGYGTFSLDEIHNRHMRTMYHRMFLLVLFYGAVLAKYAQELTRLEQKGKLDDVHQAYLEFTNTLWFARVSTQVQGTELFDLMRRRSSIEIEHQQINDEIQSSNALKSKQEEERRARIEHAITKFGVPLVAGGTFAGAAQLLLPSDAQITGRIFVFIVVVTCSLIAYILLPKIGRSGR